jgi:O-antigen ligase
MSDAVLLTRRGLSRVADVATLPLLAWLLYEVMFLPSQALETHGLLIGALATLARVCDPRPVPHVPWQLAAYAAIGVLSAVVHQWAIVPQDERHDWLRLLMPANHLIVMLLLVAGMSYVLRLRWRLQLFVVLFTLCTSVLAAQIVFDRATSNFLYERAGAKYLPSVAQWAGLHQTGLVLGLAFPLMLSLVVQARSRVQFAAGSIAAGALTVVAFFNGSRSGLAVMAVTAMLMTAAAVLRVRKVSIRAVIGAVAMLVVITASILFWMNSRRETGSLTAERGPIWQAAISMAAHHPLLGVGPGNYLREMLLGGYRERFLLPHTESTAGLDHAHNWYLQTAAEKGIIAALLVVAVFWRAMVGCWRAWKGNELPLVSGGLLFVLVVFLLRSLTDNLVDLAMTADRIRTLLWLLLAASLAAAPRIRGTAPR